MAEQAERSTVGRRLGVARSSEISEVLQAVMGLMIPLCRIRKLRRVREVGLRPHRD